MQIPTNRDNKFMATEARCGLRLIHGPGRTLLLVGIVLCGARNSLAQSATTSSPSTPGQSIPGTSGVSSFAGSVSAKLVPGVLPLSLRDAIDRGLKQNLGLLLSNSDIRSARGQRWEQLSALLPHVTAGPYIADSEINLAELGFGNAPGLKFPRPSALSLILTHASRSPSPSSIGNPSMPHAPPTKA